MREASKWLDTVNLMCYDTIEVDDHNTGHDAPLYTNPADPKAFSTDRSVRENLAAQEFRRATARSGRCRSTGRRGRMSRPPTTDCGSPFQPQSGGTPGYGQIVSTMVGKPGWVRYWDPVARNSICTTPRRKTFLTCDLTRNPGREDQIRERQGAGRNRCSGSTPRLAEQSTNWMQSACRIEAGMRR